MTFDEWFDDRKNSAHLAADHPNWYKNNFRNCWEQAFSLGQMEKELEINKRYHLTRR